MVSQFPAEMLERIQRSGIIAVLVIEDVAHAVPVARSLLDGGVDVMELTLRTPAAVDCLRAVRRDVPEMLAGIGTVLAVDQIDHIVEADASFGVAPGLNRQVVQRAQQRGLPFAPGIMTPSDIELAVELGCRELKFFPAESSGGLKQLTSMKAPYAHLGLKFIPLGGLSKDNMSTYLADRDVMAIGGSWLAKGDVIRAEQWDVITENAATARQLVNSLRAEG